MNQVQPRSTHMPSERAHLDKIVQDTQEILMSVKTVFPIDLFPDTITVDRTQVTVIHRQFLFTGQVTSIRIEDILNVMAEVGPIFGTVTFSTRFFDAVEPYRVERLWRDDALKLKSVINGLIVAQRDSVDSSQVDGDHLVTQAEELGGNSDGETP